jgi:hypothetical protein
MLSPDARSEQLRKLQAFGLIYFLVAATEQSHLLLQAFKSIRLF